MSGLATGVGPAGSSTGSFLGELAELRIHGVARPNAVIATEYVAYNDPAGFSGHSTFDLVNTNQGPVAVPLYVTCTKGATQDYDPLAQCFDADGDTMTITGATNGAHGTVTRINSNTKVRYAHDDTAATTDSFTYTISDGSLTSVARITVTILPASGEIPNSTRQYSVTNDTDMTAYLAGSSTYGTRSPGDQANVS